MAAAFAMGFLFLLAAMSNVTVFVPVVYYKALPLLSLKSTGVHVGR